MEQRKGRRLILIPLPLQGHINPMLQLAHILHSKGFSITLIHTSFNSPNPSNYPHFTFHSIPYCYTQSHSSAADILDFVTAINFHCSTPFRECLEKLISDAPEEPVACLISDAMCFFTQAVADSLRLPRIVLRTGGASSFVAFAAFPVLREKSHFPINESKMEEAVEELPPLRVKDLPMINTKEPDKYYELICRFVKGTMSSVGVIWNSFEELESPALAKLLQQFSIPMFPIGPFHKYLPSDSDSSSSSSSSLLTQDQSCISWLDKQKHNSVVYVSFGSIAAITETDFLEIALGLANSNQPFLWVVRPGMISGLDWLQLLPDGFLENLEGRCHVVKWAPQQEVLAHPAVGAFWTHSGWNSTLESICEGVPMICMPFFTDQRVNARYVSSVWKIGLQLEKGVESEEIESSIRKIMAGNEGKEMRERALRLKEMANICLRTGGSSYCCMEGLVNHILSLESSLSFVRNLGI